jgi:DTW domain-containing protein YfiP
MSDGACVCALIPRLSLRTRLLVAFHVREWSKTTNTGHLAAQAVAGSRCALWGLGDRDAQADGAPTLRYLDGGAPERWRNGLARAGEPTEAPWAFVLTTSDATPLEPAALPPGPLLMVVPDGTWQQAGKMPRRIPALSQLPRLSLPASTLASSPFRLRVAAQPGALATLHAVALALGLIEGPDVAAALLAPYEAFVARTLASRGPERRRLSLAPEANSP